MNTEIKIMQRDEVEADVSAWQVQQVAGLESVPPVKAGEIRFETALQGENLLSLLEDLRHHVDGVVRISISHQADSL